MPPVPESKILKNIAPPSTSAECTDFSGTWKGTCIEGDSEGNRSENEETITVVQHQCQSLEFNGDQTYEIGGSATDTRTSGSNTMTNTTYYDWNAEKDAITTRIMGTGRGLSQGFSYIMRFEGSFLVKMDGDKMLVAGKGSGEFIPVPTGEIAKSESSQTCTYVRQ